MKYKNALNEACGVLQNADIADANYDSWLLLEYVTGLTRQQYYMCMEDEMPEDSYDKYLDMIKMRAGRIPLQHITHEQSFMGLSFYVNEHVLVPRQDTEILVEEALKHIPSGGDVLDVCTGSGCIIISLMHYSEADAGLGTDISFNAIQVARRNATSLDSKAEFVESDLFDNIHDRYDVIVSNPPYIASAQIEHLEPEVKFHDPILALDGSDDGLIFYRSSVAKAFDYLKPGGYLLFEIGYDQGEAVASLMKEKGFTDVLVIKDLSGLDRVVKGKYNV